VKPFSRPEILSFGRPIRSDFPQGPNYARRRVVTVLVLLMLIGAGAYAVWGPESPPLDPADIPTIAAEGGYKVKPDDPGGIDIPHQDVRVYEELEGKNPPAKTVEHLLPPPEEPKETPPAPVADAAPTPIVQTTVTQEPKPAATTVAEKIEPSAAAPAETTVEAPKEPVAEKAPEKVVETPKKVEEAPSLDSVIEKIGAKTTEASGTSVIQLASSSNEKQAIAQMESLQKKFASQLGNVKLRTTRADLGSKGVYYRIQSESLSRDEATRLCSSLKKINAGCIVVGK